MPRKTHSPRTRSVAVSFASMRPRPDAAENLGGGADKAAEMELQ